MTETPRWLQSVLDAAEEKTPQLTYERDNRPALDIRRVPQDASASIGCANA
ncbi:MAG: hypothetical protein QNJ03_04775 [Dinoroseobacter sp.]|nr:hypothetical protein [Dinoroseobacter sp.]